MSTAAFEIFWIISALALLGFAVVHSLKTQQLSRHLLYFICGASIFWQEFYADWGAFLEWNPGFHMMPWGKTLWSIEHKPWFNIAAYPVFMWAAFTAIHVLLARLPKSIPPGKLFLTCTVVAGPVLYGFNVITEYLAVAQAGLWTYTETIGPALRTDAGTMPLLYPGIPFASFAVLLSFFLHWHDSSGKLRIEALAGPSLQASPVKRILFWVVIWNACYWLALCTPLIAIRSLFG